MSSHPISFKMDLNIIPYLCLDLPSCLFLSGFPTKIQYAFVVCFLLGNSPASEFFAVFYLFLFAVFFTLDAGLLARSQYSEGPATSHLDTGFSWFPCVYKQMLRWFPTFQVATTCFSCSPPDLNLVVTNFIFCIHVK